MSEGNNNQWFVWLVVISVVVVTLLAFNYSSQNAEMSDIFTDEEFGEAPTIEYEFVDSAPPKPAAEPVAQAFRAVKPVTQSSAPAPSAPAAAQTVTRTAPAATSTTTASRSGKYAIQVMASKDKGRLEIDLKEAKDKGHPAYIFTKTLDSGSTWHRMYIGPFATKGEANSYLPKVKQNYKDGFIISTK